MLPDTRSASFLGLSTLSLLDILLEVFLEDDRDDLSGYFLDLGLASCISFSRNSKRFFRHLSDLEVISLSSSSGELSSSFSRRVGKSLRGLSL